MPKVGKEITEYLFIIYLLRNWIQDRNRTPVCTGYFCQKFLNLLPLHLAVHFRKTEIINP